MKNSLLQNSLHNLLFPIFKFNQIHIFFQGTCILAMGKHRFFHARADRHLNLNQFRLRDFTESFTLEL